MLYVYNDSTCPLRLILYYLHSFCADFDNTSFTETVPANTDSFTLPRAITYYDDLRNEDRETFILVAKVLGPAAERTCFQRPQGDDCFPIGAAQMIIGDNDRKFVDYKSVNHQAKMK